MSSKNISGVVVQTKPEFLRTVLESLEETGVCDVHFYDEKGRIIITIEGENTEEEVSKLKIIQSIPYVISAEMHFSYTEEELDRAIKEINKNTEKILNFLNDDKTPIEKIKYSGHLKDI
ncbi:MAG: chaperone NapD [Hydrogenothermaceae bacterium]